LNNSFVDTLYVLTAHVDADDDVLADVPGSDSDWAKQCAGPTVADAFAKATQPALLSNINLLRQMATSVWFRSKTEKHIMLCRNRQYTQIKHRHELLRE
jgi:hypothetical protein